MNLGQGPSWGGGCSLLPPMKQYGFFLAVKRFKTVYDPFMNIYQCLPQHRTFLDIQYVGIHYLVYVRPEIE